LSDHVVGKVGVLLAHDWGIVGKSGHELQRILTGSLSEILVLDHGDAELNEAIEERLEHLGRDFSKIDERDESLGEEISIARVFDGWQDVEDLADERVVLGLRLLGDGAEEGCKGLDGRNPDLSR